MLSELYVMWILLFYPRIIEDYQDTENSRYFTKHTPPPSAPTHGHYEVVGCTGCTLHNASVELNPLA